MEPLVRKSGVMHNVRCRAALVVVGAVWFTMSGLPLGLAEEPAPTASLHPAQHSTTADSLTISSTVIGSHVTANIWSIKSEPKNARVALRSAGPASMDFAVEVTHRGRTLTTSDVSGTVTVHNAGTTSLAATVTDAFVGIPCVVVDGAERTIPALGSVDFPFTCELDSDFQPSDTDSNVASVTWEEAGVRRTAETPAEEIGWDGLYLDNTVDVHDIDGDELSVLGSLTVSPGGSLRLLTPESGTVEGSTARFSYQVQLDGRAGTCTPYATTAVVAGDEGEHVASDPASVEVCVSSAAPGLPRTGN